MMSKETFIKRIGLIQNFHSQQETLSTLIEKISDGYCVVNIGDYLVSEMITMMEEDLKCSDWIEWWMFEEVEKVIYDNETKEEISVRTLEELYDYLSKGDE